MDDKRRGDIARAAVKMWLRKNFPLKEVSNIKRASGNIAKEPEMVSIGATPEEIGEFTLGLLEELWTEMTLHCGIFKKP